MSKAEDRRKAQDDYDLELDRQANVRPNIPPIQVPEGDRCYNGQRHDVSMRGKDGVSRCWYCVKTRAQIESAKQK